MTAVHIFLEYASTKDDIQRELSITQQAFESSLATSLWILDLYQLEITADGITKTPLITGIDITDEEGKLVIQKGSSDRDHSTKSFWHEFPLIVKTKKNSQNVGIVRLYSDESIVFNRIKLGIQILLINAALKTFILSLLISIIFHRLLTKPLEKLALDATNIDLNSMHKERISVGTSEENELKLLELALNSMMDKISASMGSLDSLNQELENKVEERTRALDTMIVQMTEDQAHLENEVAMRKQREKELEEGRRELQRSLDNLRLTQEQLIESEKMASLGSLVAGVAHEINTPVGISLTGITHFQFMLDKINKQYKAEDLDEAQFEKFITDALEIARSINISLERAAKLVNSFKRVAVDQSHEQLHTFNFKEYLDEVLLSLQSKIKGTRVRVELECDPTIKLTNYPGSWSQIITNFITNSLTHGYAAHQDGTIHIRANIEEGMLLFVYHDDGNGIPDEIKTKVFDPFYTTNRENGGSGLGLNIVYNLVTQQMGGTITLESNEGAGVIFTILIPIDISASR
ncbi:MAG: hypothetical protein K6L80_16190 [Agarilytica sp.]